MVENLLFLDNEHTEIGEFDSLPSEKIYYVVMTKYKILCLKYKQDNGKEENIVQFTRNYVETEPFHKIFTPGN